MKKLILPLLLACSVGYANQEPAQPLAKCIPKIQKQTLTYKATDNIAVYFAGFIIELPTPKRMGLFSDNTIFKYDNNKTIYLTDDTNILSENREADYNPVTVYKEAFGIEPRQEKNKDEIAAIIRFQRLCENDLIQYQIKGINDLIIRTTGQNNANENTIETFILSRSEFVYVIGFKGFTNNEIDQLLSTIHKPIKQLQEF